MYSKKSVGPEMEPWGTPTLTGYSYEDFPSRTTWSCLLLRKKETRSNIWPDIPEDVSLWRRPTCQTLLKALDISSATAWVTTDMLKALAILSDTLIRRSALDQEDIKPYQKSEKRSHLSRWSESYLFTSFSKTLVTVERRLIGWEGPMIRTSNNLEHKTPSDTYWRVQLVFIKKVQTHSSLEPPLECNQDQTIWWIKVYYDLFNHIGSYRNIMQFQISSRSENN